MATYKIVDNATSTSGVTYTSSSTETQMWDDNYGTLVITHGGSRLAEAAAMSAFLQGSLDGGSTWFDIEVFKPSDTAYKNGNLGSWFRVVALAPLVRFVVTNTTGSNITGITVWIID